MKKRMNKKLYAVGVFLILYSVMLGFMQLAKADETLQVPTSEEQERADAWASVEDGIAYGQITGGIACKTRHDLVMLLYAAYYMNAGTQMLAEAKDTGVCYKVNGLADIKPIRILRKPDGSPLLIVTLEHDGKTSWAMFSLVDGTGGKRGQEA